MSQTPLPDDQRILSDLETLKIYFDPLRTRIMQLLVGQPRTVHDVAEQLGVPFTRLYYQFNLLEKHGLIRVVETRTLAGAVGEKFYQISAREFVVDRRLLTMDDDGEQRGLNVILDTVLTETADDIRASVRDGLVDLARMSPDGKALFIRRGSFMMTPERARLFQEKIITLFKETYVEQSEADDQLYAIAIAFYPTSFTHGAADDPESWNVPDA
ncbi:MAG: winged helix-turn-helix transcriptional regulator [Anaerolineae bacterium]|nr:winged helix-turn-helix transcriptional regulator [Anaerolineae bacterium]